jgi:hypothetical protein
VRPSTSARFLPVSFLFAVIAGCDADGASTERCIPIEPDRVLRAAKPPGEKEQGSTLQGSTMQGRPVQGENDQGRPLQGSTMQGTVLGIEALDGMRLALADGSAPVVVQQGRLVAGDQTSAAALRHIALVGTSSIGETFTVVIDAVVTIDGSERISIVAGGAPVCSEGQAGMFVPGRWDDSGAHSIDGDEITYACMDGVIAKCVSWGYAPWDVGAELHQTCTRLARADYCGDGQPWTMNGTFIDVYDVLGVQDPVHDPEFSFEAAWGEDGAICVNATRYDITGADGETVLPACFAGLPRCTSLAEATELGAVIANESAHTPIDACGI